MSTIRYKEYQASVEYDDGAFFVKVLHIDDLLIAQFDLASEADGVLQRLVDDYLEQCRLSGREPSRPFKGSFNVRVQPELHRRAAMAAAEDGQSLNAWVCEALSEKLECSRLSDRIHNVTTKQVASVWRLASLSYEEAGVLRRPIAFSGHSAVNYTVALEGFRKDKSRQLHG